jgi:hypothetical protein
LSVGVDCGAVYPWRARALRGSLLRPPLAGFSALASAAGSGADLTAARSPWSNSWPFRIPEVVPQPPVLRSPANGASINSGRLEWSHPLYPAETLVYEVEITTNPAQHQQAYWVHNRPQSPSLRVADRDRLAEAHFPVSLGTGGRSIGAFEPVAPKVCAPGHGPIGGPLPGPAHPRTWGRWMRLPA